MSRTLLLIDERCTTCLHDTVAGVGATHVTVAAVPRLPVLWQYAPLSGHVTVDELHADAVVRAQDLACRTANALPDTYSVDHRVVEAWCDVTALIQQGAFNVAVLAFRPGRRARRMIRAAGLASGVDVAGPPIQVGASHRHGREPALR